MPPTFLPKNFMCVCIPSCILHLSDPVAYSRALNSLSPVFSSSPQQINTKEGGGEERERNWSRGEIPKDSVSKGISFSSASSHLLRRLVITTYPTVLIRAAQRLDFSGCIMEKIEE
ncbi:hypothetical protein TNCV_4955181 [Trichonephila clavipes]|nr:hypothetical protein TNCV_4955181 [Trichonephila clavipes]